MSKRELTRTAMNHALTRRETVLTICALAVLLPVLLPCLVTFSPSIYFDVDPRSIVGDSRITVFGPTGSAWLHVISVLIGAVAMVASLWAGGKVRWVSCTLVGLGMLACGYHMTRSQTNLLQGGAWIAAAALGLGALHLSQHRVARRWLIGGLIAILIPISLDAVWFVLVEHPDTVEHFHADEAAFLQSRGMEAGSAQHKLFVRRLESADAIGAFSLSNVLGSIVAGLSLLTATICLGALLTAGKRRNLMVVGLVTCLGLVAVYFTHSKGAAVAIPAGLLLMGLAVLLRGRHWGRPVLVTAALGMIGLAIIAVLARGMLGPPSSVEGERSILFRFYYWQAAVRIVKSDPPGSVICGVGADGFSQGYLRAKNPLNPEEVTSAHNVFVDFITMLGVGGWAWCGALLLWIAAAACAVGRPPPPPDEETSLGLARVSSRGYKSAGCPPAGPADLHRRLLSQDTSTILGHTPGLSSLVVAGTIILGFIIFGMQYVLEFPQLWFGSTLVWLLGAVGCTVVMIALLHTKLLDGRYGAMGLFVAATAVLMHNQIEMTFFNASSAAIVWVIVAVAGGLNIATYATVSQPKRWRELVCGGALAVIAIVMVVGYALPVTKQQQHLHLAAVQLRRGLPRRAIEQLDQAGQLMPTDFLVLKWRLGLRLEWAASLAQAQRIGESRRIIDDAFSLLDDDALGSVPFVALDRHRARLHQVAADLFNEPAHLQRAAQSFEDAIGKAPYSIPDHLRLADIYFEQLPPLPPVSNPQRAAELYRRVLELSDFNYLDPARQLTTKQRKRITQRLDGNEW